MPITPNRPTDTDRWTPPPPPDRRAEPVGAANTRPVPIPGDARELRARLELDDDGAGLRSLTQIAYGTAVLKGWHEPRIIEGVTRQASAGERVALIHEEATELLRHVRDNRPSCYYAAPQTCPRCSGNTPPPDARPDVYNGVTDPASLPCSTCHGDGAVVKLEGAGYELADIIIRCLDYAGRYDIPIAELVVAKMRHNLGREHRHGGHAL